jgi:hypothetical protein
MPPVASRDLGTLKKSTRQPSLFATTTARRAGRGTTPAGRIIGSGSKTLMHRPCGGLRKKTGTDGCPSLPAASDGRRNAAVLHRQRRAPLGTGYYASAFCGMRGFE